VNGGPMNRGGIEAFMMNYVRHVNLKIVHIDFAVIGAERVAYDDELEMLGCDIFRLPRKSKHPIQFQRQLKKILIYGQYQIIHSHADAMSCWILKVAKECNIPVRIAHSHNTEHLTRKPVKYFLNELARKRINQYATERFACSEEAGKWLFGEARFTTIRNAIDTIQFEFDAEKRRSVREKYHILEGQILLGHVGRFDTQKNHFFLIEVFSELVRKCELYRLMLVGDGWLRKDIEMVIREKNLSDKVILAGQQASTSEYYSAFDLFVFPSLFEGLGFVLIEAQANGLSCVCSENVPKATNLSGSDRMFYLQIEKDKWIEQVLKMKIPPRYDGVSIVTESGYDIAREAQKLEERYLELANR